MPGYVGASTPNAPNPTPPDVAAAVMQLRNACNLWITRDVRDGARTENTVESSVCYMLETGTTTKGLIIISFGSGVTLTLVAICGVMIARRLKRSKSQLSIGLPYDHKD